MQIIDTAVSKYSTNLPFDKFSLSWLLVLHDSVSYNISKIKKGNVKSCILRRTDIRKTFLCINN